MKKMIDNRMENLKSRINQELAINFDSKLNLSKVKEISNNKFEVFISYNKIFNIIDNKNKMVYVRNIHFENIFNKEIYFDDKLNLSVNEINSSLKDELLDLRDNLFSRVLERKDLVIKILKNIHITSAFLNKFYTLFNDLVYSDVITKKEIDEYLKHNPKTQKYIELVIDSKLAILQDDGSLKASNSFKKILEENKDNPALAVEEAIYCLIKSNYDYIVYELGLRHIKAYLNIVACIYYLTENHGLSTIDFSIDNLYKVYCNIFDHISRVCFKDRVTSLIVSQVFLRTDNSVRLAIA